MTTWNAAPMPELGLELVRDVDRERFRSRLPRWDPRLWGDAQFSKNTRPGNRLLKQGLAWGRERVKARKLQQENVTPKSDVAPVSRFTGKEEDVEVGLIYFGKRYLNPFLGRWMSADPLAVHSPGEADLNLYAYVGGRVLKNVDPVGLDAASGQWSEHSGPTGQASYMQDTDTVNADVVAESADIVGMTIKGPGTVNGHVDGVTHNVPGAPKPETTEQVLRLPQHEGLRQLVGGSAEMGGALRLHNQFATAMSETAEVGADVGMVMFDVATLGASPTGDMVMAKRLAQMERLELTPPSFVARVERAGGTSPWTADLSNVTGKAAQARNRAIEAISNEDLSNVRLTFKPQYSPFASSGVAKFGEGTQIGKRAFDSRAALRETILHEELHHRWWARGISSPHHSPDAFIPNERFYEVLGRFNRMKGWAE